jgi:hypothetical protein
VDINELAELISTYSEWAVNSMVSGDFDQRKYGCLMGVVDKLIEFIYTPELTKDDKFNEGASSSLSTNTATGNTEMKDSSNGNSPAVLGVETNTDDTGVSKSTLVFMSAILKYLTEHPESGNLALFMKIESNNCVDGLIDGE